VSQLGDDNFSSLSFSEQVQNILNPDSPVEFDSCIYFFLQRLFIARSHALAASAECEGERLCPVAASS